jgi:uncharacterized protein (TIGR00299 family) protein
MKIAVFDPFSGASGDMILGALVDAGAPLPDIQKELDRLALSIRLRAEPVSRNAVRGTRVAVEADEDAHSRTWRDIRALIERSSLEDAIKERALAIFGRLARAEAKVHDSDVERVHFHEVGGLDAIADICGACIALDLLGIEQVVSGPLRTGSGFVRAAHGLLPVPAPATAELIAEAGAPISTALPSGNKTPGELLTPTGAAILTTIASFAPVEFTPLTLGYGFGTRELPWPNALRLWVGETTGNAPEEAGEIVIETNLDDMSPQLMELLVERLFEAGALDVWLTPIIMKKGRPATMVAALLPAARRSAVESAMIENSTTLGVRVTPVDRTKADRRFESVTTRWGDVTVKLRGWNGRVIDVAPEYDDCVRIARGAEIPLRDVWNEAHRIAESYVGRRLSSTGELI